MLVALSVFPVIVFSPGKEGQCQTFIIRQRIVCLMLRVFLEFFLFCILVLNCKNNRYIISRSKTHRSRLADYNDYLSPYFLINFFKFFNIPQKC
ncbi:MAG: hypothetical protein DCC43_14070 [Candidatus Brocadia sp.]|nr:hypothetical protein [Candidatus Brocadia sp. AMX3]RIJ91785.1 MAG: hypothetical protein DCC43_14070 [Candidatus Brocadia sp.]